MEQFIQAWGILGAVIIHVIVVAYQHGRLTNRVAQLEFNVQQHTGLSERIARLEEKIGHLTTLLERLEKRLDP